MKPILIPQEANFREKYVATLVTLNLSLQINIVEAILNSPKLPVKQIKHIVHWDFGNLGNV